MSSGDFAEDLVPSRKRALSISSVDSEPIKPRIRGGEASVYPDSGGEASDCSADESGAERDDAPARVQKDSLLDAVGAVMGPLDAEPVSGWVDVVPANRVSEAPVAVVTSVRPSSGVCVAELANRTLTMDTGTRFCLSDGRAVGCVASLLGPVQEPLYLIACTQTEHTRLLLQTAEEGSVRVGTPLHYDLAHPHIIFSPRMQCDVTRGTDASYVNDEELPDNVRPDFSDDEQELRWKREYKANRLAGRELEPVSSEDDPIDDIAWDRIDTGCETVTALELLSDGPPSDSLAASGPEAPKLLVPAWVPR